MVKNIAGLKTLEESYPRMKERLSDNGKVRYFINIYLNNEGILFLNKEDTTLKNGDTISIAPAITGRF